MTAPDLRRRLRWYPRVWRDRYGDEFLALMEDHVAERGDSFRVRAQVARAGLRERAHGAGIKGVGTPETRVSAALTLALSAGAVFMLCGIGFAKVSEHFVAALPATHAALPRASFDVVAATAVGAGVVVAAGVTVALPACFALLRGGGWPAVRRRICAALAASALAAVGVLALLPWAHSLSPAQRNGANSAYSAAGFALGALVACAMALWARAGMGVVRRLEWSRRALVAEGCLAVLLAAAMATITTACALWWACIAADAPWFLSGSAKGSSGSIASTPLMVSVAGMMLATAVAAYAAARVVRPLRQLTRQPR